MKKLKYGLLLILSMILFSVPVLAAKTTYYLPSKVVYGGGHNYNKYSYDKYGHMIERSVSIWGKTDEIITWKYKYDKNGKRTTGERYYNGQLSCKLTFDKNDHLTGETYVSKDGKTTVTVKFKWNAKGYFEESTYFSDYKYKYYYYKSGKIKKRAAFRDSKLSYIEYFDNSGLRSKNPPVRDDYKETYEYVLNKNGLVKTKEITEEDVLEPGIENNGKFTYYYSKTKTDAKTYYQFIDGWDSCRNNGNL